MNFDILTFLPEAFDQRSRVWIYQSSRLFSLSEVFQIEDLMKSFVATWNSHGTPVNGFANLFFGQFIILMADERASMVSGCSKDSSVRLIKAIESLCDVQLFDRQLLAFYIREKVQLLPLSQLPFAVANGFIQPDTLYFNNTVLTKEDLETNWIIPVKSSWLASRVQFPETV